MKTKLILLLACITVVNFSCTKSGTTDDTTPPAATVKLLTRITTTNKNGTTFSTFTYNDQKQLISSKVGTIETVYLYKDGLIYKTVKTGTSQNTETVFEYDGNKIRKVTVQVIVPTAPPPGVLTEHIYGYVWSGDNVVEIDHNQNFERTGTYTLELTGRNATKITASGKDGASIQAFTFDSNKTPYDNLNARMVLMIADNPLNHFSANNILTSSTTYPPPTSNLPGQYTCTYTYDADGFPLTKVLSASVAGGTPFETKYTYEYTEF